MPGNIFASNLVAGLAGAPLPGHLGLAVSGGGDSMALLHLAAGWGWTNNVKLTVFTVDHGFRPEAAGEARFVAGQAAKAGLDHQTITLDWPDGRPSANLQAKARAARYEALAKAAQKRGIDHLVTAHTRDDQAETFLLRLARGSGLDGLTAMAPVTALYGLIILRPLLSCGRDDLRALLKGRGLDWIEDPSNADRHFARVRIRALLPRLAAEGMTPERLARTADVLRQSRAALDEITSQLLKAHGKIAPQGFVTITRTGLMETPRAIGLRALARLLRTVCPRPYQPRAGRLEALYDNLVSRDWTGRRTLGGCLIRAGAEHIEVFRELRRTPDPLPVKRGQKLVWDDRFDLVVGARAADGYEVRPLGTAGLKTLKLQARKSGYPPPKGAWYVNSPSLWRRGELCSVPFCPYPELPAGPAPDLLKACFRQERLGFMR